MKRITVDEELRRRLHNLTEPLELCDPSGRVLPQPDPVEDRMRPQIGEEEICRREQSNETTCTPAEVLAFLEKL
jgi:hypothetical protein